MSIELVYVIILKKELIFLKLSQIDKNLEVNTAITATDIEWYDVTEAPFEVCGVFYDKNEGAFLRMPREISKTVSPKVDALNAKTSGGRVRFKSDSDYIAITVELSDGGPMAHMASAGQNGFDLYKNNRFCRLFTPPHDLENGYSSERKLDGEMAEYTINFPLYRGVKRLLVAVRKGAKIETAHSFSITKPVVFYGSSITQGACASRPGNNYVNTLMRKIDADYINLGFSGSCKAEEPMAHYIASLEMSALVYDFDHNVRNPEQLKDTHKPFFDIVRKERPDLPIIMVTAPDAYFNGASFYTRRDIIYNNYLEAKKSGDNNVYYVDGSTLFPQECIDNCIVDGTHPGDLGYYFMAEGIYEPFKSIF